VHMCHLDHALCTNILRNPRGAYCPGRAVMRPRAAPREPAHPPPPPGHHHHVHHQNPRPPGSS
jgi:hypothetical protein